MTGRAETASAPASESPEGGFWARYQPGFRFSGQPVGSPAFFREVERHRYELEPHIEEIARFEAWERARVLEVGCGIATDGARFARAGAIYTGVDASGRALELAERRFGLERLRGSFARASATALPFADDAFDLVYSHGVIHHIDDTQAAVDEMRRVLRPGGAAIVMVYHRSSLNYYVNILLIRRLLAGALLIPGAPGVISRATREEREVLEGHLQLLRRHGLRYLLDTDLFLSNNTDGPGNPRSKVYTGDEARRLFSAFADVATEVRFLNLRLLPGGARLERTVAAGRLARRIGWHLYVRARA